MTKNSSSKRWEESVRSNDTNGWLLESYVLATSVVILWWVSTCHSEHSWRLYNACPLGNQAMTQYPTQSHHPNTKQNGCWPILLTLGTWLGSNKHRFYKSLLWLDQESNFWYPGISQTRVPTLSIWPLHWVYVMRAPSSIKQEYQTAANFDECTSI